MMVMGLKILLGGLPKLNQAPNGLTTRSVASQVMSTKQITSSTTWLMGVVLVCIIEFSNIIVQQFELAHLGWWIQIYSVLISNFVKPYRTLNQGLLSATVSRINH